MTGREGFIWGALSVVLSMVVVYFVATVGLGVQAVECVEDHSWGPTAMQVRVHTDRRGEIVERSIGTCTFFSYRGPGLGSD